MTKMATAAGLLAASVSVAGCACGRTGVTGRISVGPGLVMIERGLLHGGAYEVGGLVDSGGNYEVELPEGGLWGVHFYVTGYFYLPLAVTIADGEMRVINQEDINWDAVGWWAEVDDPVTLPMLPDSLAEDNPDFGMPIIEETTLSGRPAFSVEWDVADPQPDLSIQVLVLVGDSNVAIRLSPPGPPVGGISPNGTYSALFFRPENLDDGSPWYFVAADFLCSQTPVLEITP